MKPKILIVDDSSLARRTTRSMLEEMGLTVDEASDGAGAIERFYLNPPDVVVLDMVMTGMYGLEVLAKLRQINPAARVIIATADIQQTTKDQVRAAGAFGFINKPINRKTLNEAITCVLKGDSLWN